MSDPYIPSGSCHVWAIRGILEAPGEGLIAIEKSFIKLSDRNLIGFKVFKIMNIKDRIDCDNYHYIHNLATLYSPL